MIGSMDGALGGYNYQKALRESQKMNMEKGYDSLFPDELTKVRYENKGLRRENDDLRERLDKAKKALLLLNEFLWYETVPNWHKETIVKRLQENECRVDQGWEEEGA